MTVGQRMRAAREKQGRTQEDIADALGKRQPTVQSWEADETLPRTNEVRAVAKEYRLRPEQLLPEEPAPQNTRSRRRRAA